MNIYEIKGIQDRISGNPYVGRGIIIGQTADASKAVIAYFIMGRSANSRNRIFLEQGDDLMIRPFDESKVEDPSLIIYYPVRKTEDGLIVTNGDQTDTIYELMDKQQTFEQSLRGRTFEPDAPNYTPRISGIMHVEGGKYAFAMSLIRTDNGDPSSSMHYTFAYDTPKAGAYRFLHTYMGDGNPLPSFEGEPELVSLPDEDIDAMTARIWDSLNQDNKVSLFVRVIDIATGEYETRIVNANK